MYSFSRSLSKSRKGKVTEQPFCWGKNYEARTPFSLLKNEKKNDRERRDNEGRGRAGRSERKEI